VPDRKPSLLAVAGVAAGFLKPKIGVKLQFDGAPSHIYWELKGLGRQSSR
jgi:hypothetical protein